jgi:CheY-like chemotaxis protein
MRTILLVGQDSRLLSTRAAVLKKTGAEVFCCGTSEALKFVELEPVDLIVLCHSLFEADAERVVERAQRRSPKPKVMFVVSDVDQEKQYGDTRSDAKILPDPKGLIERAVELLQEWPDGPRKEAEDRHV